MTDRASVIQAKVYHRRLFPKVNRFRYSMLYLALPLSKLDSLNIGLLFGINRHALMSFWSKDHGSRNTSDLRGWAQHILANQGVDDVDGEIVLVTLPRIFGYVFNPVSFWLCFQRDGALRAVIAEVNNTFGETHSYVCAAEDGVAISSEDVFFADKEFHVSPFLKRSGHYRFYFDTTGEHFAVRINYFDADDKLQLQTSIGGDRLPWSQRNLLAGWFRSPLMALKATALIHWQAIKLLFKSAKYIPKPTQHLWIQTRALKDDGAIDNKKINTLVQKEYPCT